MSFPECTYANIKDYSGFNCSSKCDFTAKYCGGQTTYINTVDLYYCGLQESILPLIALAVPWLLLCFYLLSSTSEKYLEPCLSRVAKTFKFSETLAGVSLIALANGAPDIISAYVAGSSGQKEGIDLAFGALIGASIFTTTVILARVIYHSKNLQLSGKIILRDCGFFIVAILYFLYLGLLSTITLKHTLFLFLGYGAYSFCVIVEEIKNKKPAIEAPTPELPSPAVPTPAIFCQPSSFPNAQEEQKICESPHKDGTKLKSNDNSAVVIAIKVEGQVNGAKTITECVVSEENTLFTTKFDLLLQILSFLSKPINWARYITIPKLDRSRYNRIRVSMYPFFSTLFVLWQFNFLHEWAFKPLFWMIFLPICVAAGGLLWIATRYRRSIKFLLYAFTVLGLALAVVWIHLAAGLLLDLLVLLKISSGLPLNFIGLTVLAWGNSANDFFVDVAIAKRGYGVMAVSGIFAGQFFNLLIGFGILLLQQGGLAKLNLYEDSTNSQINYFLIIFLLASLVSMAVYSISKKFKMGSRYCLYLFIFYALFCLIISGVAYF